MNSEKVHQVAEELFLAEKNRKPVAPISKRFGINLAEAYQVQLTNASKRIRSGEVLTGYKVGLTSLEAQKHFNLFHPDFGHLFESMCVDSEGEVDLSGLIQPKIEAEIAFVLGKDLKGPGVTVAEVARAVDFCMGAFEIVDSRIEKWQISGTDTIADNGSSARYALTGIPIKIENLDLAHLGMALSVNGEVVSTACGAAVMGNPLNALAFLANELGAHGRELKAGETVLSGSLGGMVAMKTGETYRAEFLKLGTVSLTAKGELP